jgi:DNA gyrase subunit A
MITKQGIIKKTTLEQYSRPRSNGIIALNIREDDQLVNVSMTGGNQHIVIAAKSGRAIHFHESAVRPMGRTATGVKAIKLNDDKDYVIGMVCASEDSASLLVVSEKGYGKRSDLTEYRITNRGGKGVKAMNVTDKTGAIVAIKEVVDSDDLMIINKSGITIRISMEQLRIMGRATQGVRLIRVGEGDEISSVEKISREEDENSESSDLATESSETTEETTE